MQCIEYRSDLQCTGDIAKETSTSWATKDGSQTFYAVEGYGRCVSWCIGEPGAISFNYILDGGTATCQCLRNIFRLAFEFQSLKLCSKDR